MDSSFSKIFGLLKNQKKVFNKAFKKVCKEYEIDPKKFELFKYKNLTETENYFKDVLGENYNDFLGKVLITFLNDLSEKDRTNVWNEIFVGGYLRLEEIEDTIQRLNIKADNLMEWIENCKRMEEAQTRAFVILKQEEKDILEKELVIHDPILEYVERKEIKEIDLEKDKKIIITGKRGSGKSRSLFEILKKIDKDIVILKSFFREETINSLDAQLQNCDNFVIVWDDLQDRKDELVNTTIKQIEQLCKDKDINFCFLGSLRIKGKHYEFHPQEVDLQELKSMKLIEHCKNYFNINIEDDVAKILLEKGDRTPFYITSFFKTILPKKKVEKKDVEKLPKDNIDLWKEHIQTNNIRGEDKKTLRSMALIKKAIPIAVFEFFKEFYVKVFAGTPFYFEESLGNLKNLFLIEKTEEDIYTMHDIQSEAVEEVFPLKKRDYKRLLNFIDSLPGNLQNVLLWNYAEKLYFEKKYEQSLDLFNKFAELNSDHAGAYNNIGNLLKELERYDEAEHEYKEAIRINPMKADPHYNLGIVLHELERYDEAEQEYQESIKIEPERADVHYNLGIVLHKLERYAEAEQEYKEAIRINPEHVKAHMGLGLLLKNLKQYDEAEQKYRKALEINPEFPKAHINLGNLLVELNRHDEAEQKYRKAIEINPESANVHYNLGALLHKLERYDEAEQEYKEAIRLNPEFIETYNNLGNLLRRLKRDKEAEKEYKKALRINPEYAEAHGNLGILFSQTRGYEGAASEFKKAGLLLFRQNKIEDAKKAFSFCFELKEHAINDNIIYCGLFLYLLTYDANIILEIKKREIKNPILKSIFTLILKKLNDKDIIKDADALEKRIETEDLKVLLDVVRKF